MPTKALLLILSNVIFSNVHSHYKTTRAYWHVLARHDELHVASMHTHIVYEVTSEIWLNFKELY